MNDAPNPSLPAGTGRPTATRLAAFWAILLATPLVLVVLAVQAYYLYAYLTLPAYYCGSFADLDAEIGWVLKPGAESCIGGVDPDTGETAFEVPVFVNADGARAASTDVPTAQGGALVIGDSWSFGYGIAYEDTFAARLDRDHGVPTALFASPAYSGVQALLLGRRAVRAARPEAIVYLELGFLWRAVCTGDARPSDILKPCYWTGPDGTAELVLPEPGAVLSAAQMGRWPGGIVGAGGGGLSYFLVSRPLAKLSQFMVRAGLASGFGDDFAPVAPEDELTAIRRAHAQGLSGLAQEAGAPLLLIDPHGFYQEFQPLPGIDYVDGDTWARAVIDSAEALPESERSVPADNHYGPGIHGLIADLIATRLAEVLE